MTGLAFMSAQLYIGDRRDPKIRPRAFCRYRHICSHSERVHDAGQRFQHIWVCVAAQTFELLLVLVKAEDNMAPASLALAAASCLAVASGHSSMLNSMMPNARGYPAGYSATAPLSDSNFTNKQGFLDAGNDILSGSYTYSQALAICSPNTEVSSDHAL
jgi:hypothetical protein